MDNFTTSVDLLGNRTNFSDSDLEDYNGSDNDDCRANELSLSTNHLRCKTEYPLTPVSDMKPEDLRKNIIKTNKLVELTHRRNRLPTHKKKEGNFRHNENVIVLKPLNRVDGRPSRIPFVPLTDAEESIANRDIITVFMRHHNKPELPLTSSGTALDKASLCECFSQHEQAVFCVNGWTYDIEWIHEHGQSPKARIFVKDVSLLRIEFASLILHSKVSKMKSSRRKSPVYELVFQVDKATAIYEQTFFIKCTASPSRDIDSFVNDLQQIGLIHPADEKPKPRTQELQAPSCPEKIILPRLKLTPKQKNILSYQYFSALST